MATLTTQEVRRSGLAPTYAAAAVGGDSFTPGDDTFLHVKNTSGGALTVTVVTPNSAFEDATIADIAVSVPATTGDRMIGPFPSQHFADPTDGLADITYSGVTNLTVAVLKIRKP